MGRVRGDKGQEKNGKAQLTGFKHWLMEKSQVASHGRLRRLKERTEEDGVRAEEGMRGLGRDIKGTFSLIRDLQDTS